MRRSWGEDLGIGSDERSGSDGRRRSVGNIDARGGGVIRYLARYFEPYAFGQRKRRSLLSHDLISSMIEESCAWLGFKRDLGAGFGSCWVPT